MTRCDVEGSNPLIVTERGKTYDLTEFAELGDIVRLAASCMIDAFSNSSFERSARLTNKANYYHIRVWLKFARESARAGVSIAYDLATYLLFETHVRNKYKPTTEIVHLIMTRRLFKYGAAHSNRPRIAFPRPPSQRLALATSSNGQTFADFYGIAHDIGGQAALNRKIIVALNNFCWQRIFELRARVARRDAWIDEVAVGNADDFRELPDYDCYLSRDEVLKVVVQYLWTVCGGMMPPLVKHSRLDSKDAIPVDHQRKIKNLLAMHPEAVPPITMLEIEDHLLPSVNQLCCFYPLFAEEGVNSCSMYELEVDMLVDVDFGGREGKEIRWRKFRAGRELTSKPFRVGGVRARTMPRAWEQLLRLTKPARDRASRDRELLFLALNLRTNAEKRREISGVQSIRLHEALSNQIQDSSSPEAAILRSVGSKFLPGLIRTTVASIKYSSDGIAGAQAYLHHSNNMTTELYLNNAVRKAHLDDKVQQGQTGLISFLLSPPTVVPPDLPTLAAEHSLSAEQAEDLINDRYNLGYGISLIDEKAFVIDTPTNFLRMQSWLNTILAAEKRLMLENPLRWDRIWLPQIELYQKALDDFPRRTRSEAAKLGELIFVFPEPH